MDFPLQDYLMLSTIFVLCTRYFSFGRDALERPYPDKLVGADYESSLDQRNDSNSAYHVKDEAGSRAASCNEEGFAAGYPCRNVDLLSMLDVEELHTALDGSDDNNAVNDIWGWTHPSSGREFSIVGLRRGTAFVEITDPYNLKNLGVLPANAAAANWRDIKVMDHYALIVSDINGHGMQIFDLEKLLIASENTLWSADANYNNFGKAHNIFVNEDTGFAYAVGSNTCNEGLHIIDVNDPLNPTFAGCFADDGYVHGKHTLLCFLFAFWFIPLYFNHIYINTSFFLSSFANKQMYNVSCTMDLIAIISIRKFAFAVVKILLQL